MNDILPFLFALYPLGLSGLTLVWLYRARKPSRLHWTMHVLTGGSMIGFVYLAGPWVFTSYHLRYVVLGLFILVTLGSYRRMERSEQAPAARNVSRPVFSTMVLMFFTGLNIVIVTSPYRQRASLDLTFPLAAGAYAVLQGGDNLITNPFHASSGNPYAVDLTKLNAAGNRAKGVAPRDLNAYAIFGETLHSPCSGRVLRLRDGMPDNVPGEVDTQRPEGNFILLECAEAQVLMAHLRQGSVRVAAGERVTTGQRLGDIGNSGNTLEPHLHIEAKMGEAHIPLKFDGRSLSINSVVHAVTRQPNRRPNRRRAAPRLPVSGFVV